MKFFKYDKFTHELTLNREEILLIKEFADVLEADKSKGKLESFKRFKYAFLKLDWESPYLFMAENEKARLSLEDSGLKETDLTEPSMVALLNKYEALMDSNIVVQQVNAANILLEKIASYAKSVDLTEIITEGPQKGKLVHSVKDARDTIMQMPKLIAQAREIRKLFDEELEEQNAKFRKNNNIGSINELEMQRYNR